MRFRIHFALFALFGLLLAASCSDGKAKVIGEVRIAEPEYSVLYADEGSSRNSVALSAEVASASLEGKYRQVSWSSSDEAVVTVDQGGRASAVGPGGAVVTARCVNPDDASDFAEDSVALAVGARADVSDLSGGADLVSLLSDAKAEQVTGKAVSWEVVEGADLAEVDGEGRLTLKPDRPAGGGTVRVRGTCEGLDPIEFSIEVGVLVRSLSVTLDGEEVSELSLPVGESAVLRVSVLPADATVKGVSWVSSDPARIKAEALEGDPSSCRVTALKVTGDAASVWAVSADAGISAKVDVEATQAVEVRSVSVSSPSGYSKIMNVGETLKLEASVATSPASAEGWDAVEWSSDKPGVASVGEDGLVTGLALGKAVITARSAKDPTKSASFEVETVVSAVAFESKDAFKLQAGNGQKTWVDKFGNADDNYIEYSVTDPTDSGSWEVWDGTSITAGKLEGSDSYRIWLRGKDNVKVSNTESTYSVYNYASIFRFTPVETAADLEIEASGDLMSLLDWQDPDNAPMSNYAFCALFASSPLVSCPELSRKSLLRANYCYASMFANCDKLESMPLLPAKVLSAGCYLRMFEECDNLKEFSEFSADVKLAPSCYSYMFYDCSAITELPSLPNKTLAESCYSFMFSGCSSLESIPDGFFSDDVQLAKSCYASMFRMQGPYGGAIESALRSISALPNKTLADSCYSYMFCGCAKLESVPDNFFSADVKLAQSCYSGMFRDTGLKTAPTLPATTLAPGCYSDMFYGCKQLTSAQEELKAENVPRNAYNYMFYGCALTTAPKIAGKTFGYSACGNMFSGCKDLTKAPDLRGSFTDDAQFAFNYMFSDCSSLENAPVLGMSNLTQCCYQGMFRGCKALKSLPEIPMTGLAQGCYQDMYSYTDNTYIKFSETQTEECPNLYMETPSEQELKDMCNVTYNIFTSTFSSSTWFNITYDSSSGYSIKPGKTYYTNATIVRASGN